MMQYLTPRMLKSAGTEPFEDLAEDMPKIEPLHPSVKTLGAAAGTLPYLPWSSVHAMHDRLNGVAHKNELPQAISTDTGRVVGGLLGLNAGRVLGTLPAMPKNNPLLSLALRLGGTYGGALLGHLKGREVGQTLFPGSFYDRMQHAVHNF